MYGASAAQSSDTKEMKKLKDQFIQHCLDNNLEDVTDCLSRGVDVNTVSKAGFSSWSGLTIEAKKNYPELLEILLSHPHIEINNTTENLGAG